MQARHSTTTFRVHLPAPHRGVVAVSATQAAELYQGLRELDRWQRAGARDGDPVSLEQECHTQTALLMIELIAGRGGEISQQLAGVLAALGIARLS